MYKFPENFTGYNAKEIGVETFKSLCYSLQGLGLIRVLKVTGYEYPKNYYSALVEDTEGQFYIYMNCFVSVFSFGEITNDREEYVDKSAISEGLKNLDSEIVVLTKLELLQVITDESKINLQQVELKELNYWLPCSVGRGMFSWFFD